MLSAITKIISDLFGLADKILPDGEDKLKFKMMIFELQSKFRNIKTVDNLTYIIAINWFVLTPIKLWLIKDYLQSVLFIGDVVSFTLAISFQYGVEFKEIIKIMLDKKNKKKRSRK